MNILVMDRAGYLGRELARLLARSCHSATCIAGDWADGRSAQGPRITGREGPGPDRLWAALRGVEALYYLAPLPEWEITERDFQVTADLGRIARASGVKRTICLTALGQGEGGVYPLVDLLRLCGPPLTEFRTGVIVGNGSPVFESIRYLAERLPVLPSPPWMCTPVQPIALFDLLQYLVAGLAAGPEQEAIEVGGPSVESCESMVLTYAGLRGLRRRALRLGAAGDLLSPYWLGLLTPISRRVWRNLISDFRHDAICRSAKAAEIFPGIRPVAYAEAVRQMLSRESPPPVRARLTADLNRPRHVLLRREGFILGIWETLVASPASAVFAVLEGIGGKRGWLFADELWQLRGLLDRMLGGPGIRRGRTDPDVLHPGDHLDFWRVETVRPNELLLLRSEMKMPGRAWLQFAVSARGPERSLITMSVFFEPRGIPGELYWALLYPFHAFIFDGMHQALASAAARQKLVPQDAALAASE